MRYMDAPQLEPQRKPLVPHKMISGMLPGATQIRIGGSSGIVLDGKNQRVSVTSASDEQVLLGRGPGNLFGSFGVVTTDPDNPTVQWSDIGQTRIIYDDTGTKRLMSGEFADGEIKIKLSQPGYDVSTATDDQLVWSSDFNMFKIVQADTVTIPAMAIGEFASDVDVAHNLGFVPAVIAFTTREVSGLGSVNQPLPAIDFDFSGGTIDSQVYAQFITDTLVRFQVARSHTTTTYDAVTIKYYLLRETATA